jgi:hypothetical protein
MEAMLPWEAMERVLFQLFPEGKKSESAGEAMMPVSEYKDSLSKSKS